jgi:hypothetical protein
MGNYQFNSFTFATDFNPPSLNSWKIDRMYPVRAAGAGR